MRKNRASVLIMIAVVSLAPSVGIAKRGHGRSHAPAPCVHPYPCGDEWPAGLEGPFDLAEVRDIWVEVPADYDDPSKGTIELRGWIGMPDVPEGVRVPVALHSTPYLGDCAPIYGQCANTPDDPAYWTGEPAGIPPREDYSFEWTWGVAPIDLVRHGYAAAVFGVRGTSNSGGCFELGGRNEQGDHGTLVNWLGGKLLDGSLSPAAVWSNGRVAMGGLSYPGWTAQQAAVAGDSALKTIVAGGLVSDLYTLDHSPQGAAFTLTTNPAFWPAWVISESFIPPLGGGVEYGVVEHAPRIPERACPEVAGFFTRWSLAPATDQRDQAYYDERRLIDRLDDISAAVLVANGFRDDGHAFQDDEVWRSMTRAPKRLIEGQWAHTLPMHEPLDPAWEHDTWSEIVFSWLDYWLWGKGPLPEKLDTVSYQDHLGTWHESTSWPPAEARDEVLYLTGSELSTEPGGASRSFRSAPNPLNSHRALDFIGSPWTVWDALCPNPVTAGAGTAGLVYMSEPVETPVTVAGNPFAYLRLSSDLPGGIVTVKIADIGPGFTCDATGQPTDVHYLSSGSADLRFHAGGYQGSDFPVNAATNVRVDLFNLAATLQPGHRLALEISYGETAPFEYTGVPYLPEITVHADGGVLASHVVLPITEGTLGGASPTADYPPKPFVPN